MTSRALIPIATPAQATATRCRDLWAWERAVADADLGRPKYVSKRTVLAVAGALRRYMHGPKHPDTGAGARPGSARLAAEIGLGRVAVDRAISELVDKGLLIREVAACPGRRAVYAAALPRVSPATHDDRQRVSATTHDPPERVSPATHRPTKFKTTTTARGEPVQLPIVASIAGGGGEPAAQPNPGPTLRAVAAALPPDLAGELLTDERRDDIDQLLEHLADTLPTAAIVTTCTGRLPAVVGNIAALLLDARIPQLQRRATGAVARLDDRRADRLIAAKRFGDHRALADVDRQDLVDELTSPHGPFPDDSAAQTAALEAFDATRAAIEQEALG